MAINGNLKGIGAAAGTILALLATYSAGVWTAASQRTVVTEQIAGQTKITADHEIRIRLIEARLSEIAAEIRWVRLTLEARSAKE